jgi:hypothetical protein
LRTVLVLKNGIPSHDTFSRIFRMLDPKSLEKAFRRFTAAFADSLRDELSRRYAFGMQGLSFPPSNCPFAVRRRELVGFVLLCQRSERQNVPFLPLLNMRHEIVSVEPLHHDNDGTPIQPVEAAAQSVVVPGIDSFTTQVR